MRIQQNVSDAKNLCINTESLWRSRNSDRGTPVSDISAPEHLNNHHRTTLFKIVNHPARRNIEWPDVRSTLDVVGHVEQGRAGRATVFVGSETQTCDRAIPKDLDVQAIVELRRMLHDAGYDA